MSDYAKRDLGIRSSMALEGLEVAIWKQSVDTLQDAEVEFQAGTLTAEKAQAYLIGLLEQRKLVKTLRNQVDQGIAAGSRIARAAETQVAFETHARQREAQGGNRFFRSKVAQVPPDDAAA